jgi:hypothetical protein
MINTYIYNKEKKVLGFTFFLFENDQFVIDYDTYDSVVDMDVYYRTSKSDVLGINIERFIRYCNDSIDSDTILIQEATNDLNKATRWRVKHKEKYKDFLELVIRAKTKMRDLVNSTDGVERQRAYMMYKIMIDFAKKELEIIKNKN